MKIVTVIPTYNEAENIGRLIPIIFEESKKISQHDFHVLVFDSASPDGTSKVVEDMMSTYPNLHLLTEAEKSGLGSAYIKAFNHASKNLNADVLIEMDADFQHDPKDLVRLIAEIDNGYDYVIGSRFTEGGSIPKEWAFKRKLMSWGGNIFSKLVLWIFNVNDFTSGFKASRVKGFVDQLDLSGVRSKGFAYKIDLLYKMHKLGAKIKEVPIAFGLRDTGDSKMERSNTIDSLRVVLSIRVSESKAFIRFVAVGFIGLFADTLFFTLLRMEFLLSDNSERASSVASAISGLLAMTVTYILNNTWSFSDRRINDWKKTVFSVLIYYTSSYLPIIFRSWLIGTAERTFGISPWVSYGAFFIGIFVGLVWNFTVYNKIIWRKKPSVKA
jgi:dolichol-phosphate mannosyltransferase